MPPTWRSGCAARRLARVLEIAAGTGVVTRALAAALPAGSAIVATDLNQACSTRPPRSAPRGRSSGAPPTRMQLPFEDASFDAVVCQFGVMFFPDKAKAFAEARRVLRPGGVFLFNAWDRIEENEFADVVTTALATVFPADPPRFMARTPHGYHDRRPIERDLADGGFTPRRRSRPSPRAAGRASPRHPAIAYCQGTPLRNEIEARDPARLGEGHRRRRRSDRRRFGRGAVDGKIQAHVVSIER